MRILIYLCGLLSFVVALSSPAQALVPPMSEEELEREADLIVEVRVAKVDAVEKSYDDGCNTWQDHLALLEISKVLKGDGQSKELTVRYSSRVGGDSDCVGGRTPYSLAPGEHYKLYLRQDKQGHYRFINWAGVVLTEKERPAVRLGPDLLLNP